MTQSKKITEFMTICRNAGLSVTPQRLTIYKALMNDRSHPNPETIYKKIKEEIPTISFATVYKTLEVFEKHGIISIVTPLHNTVRYDPLITQHHHMVCTKCKKVIDVFSDELNALNIPEAVYTDNQLVNYQIQFNVICEDCQKR